MKKIVVTSQKGGAGKTTLARSLAVAADAAGQRVAMIDLDPQKSLREWWDCREAETPMMFSDDPHPERLGAYLERMSGQFDLVVIDTPPRMEKWLPNILESCDLAVIPVRASPDDLRAVRLTIQAAKSASAPFVFVLSQTTRAKIVDATLKELAARGRVAPVQFVSRVSHPEASITGHTASETQDTRASEEIAALWAYVEEVMSDG